MSTVDVLYEPCKTKRLPLKERRALQAKLTQFIREAKIPDAEVATFMSHLPRHVFEDFPRACQPDLAVDAVLLGMKIYGDDADVPGALRSMKDRASIVPYESPQRDRTETMRNINTIVKNEQRGESPAPRQPGVTFEAGENPPVHIPKPKKSKVKQQEPSDDDETEEIQEPLEDDDSENIGEYTFKNLAVLYEVSRWAKVPTETIDELERALRGEFLLVPKAGSWEYQMAETAIEVAIKSWEQGVEVKVVQLVVDQFLLRLKLKMEGVEGAQINNAMKKLQMNSMPKRYRNILQGNNATKGQFGQKVASQSRGRGQQSQGSQQSFRGNRVPPALWATLTPEQKNTLKTQPAKT